MWVVEAAKDCKTQQMAVKGNESRGGIHPVVWRHSEGCAVGSHSIVGARGCEGL